MYFTFKVYNEYMLPIKTLKIHIHNHSEIPYPSKKQKNKKQNSYHKLYQKTHAIKSMPYKE